MTPDTLTRPPAARLAALAATSRELSQARKTAAALTAERNAQVVALASDGTPHTQIAEAAGVTQQAVSKIAAAGGLPPRRKRSAA